MDHTTTHDGHDQHGASAIGHGDHDRHEGHSVAMFRDKFWLSLGLTIPVLIWSPDIQAWFGYTAPVFPGSEYIPVILGTFIFLYGGGVFLRGARGELAMRQPGMMTLISLAITVAYVYSMAVLVLGSGEDFFWELVTLIDVMLLGHWIEMRSVRQASGALNELAKLLENGLPDGVPFAHKVGWIDDTHGDGGIIYSPGGDYVLVMALYSQEWLEWEDSAPLGCPVEPEV